MADKAIPPASADSIEESLLRLSKKPGVKAWLMLDRSTGAVLKTNGQIAAVRAPKSMNEKTPAPSSTSESFSADANADVEREMQAAQELGSMIFSFLATSGKLVEEIDTEDELKLLRLRTKKEELVIVPEAKYILVVVHDTPPA